MDRIQERGVIAHNVQNVFKSFRNVATSFKQDTESPDDQWESSGLCKLLPNFENEITRFNMWAGNLAAHQSGQASLDHRLREAPHLQEQVVYLLLDISESLEDTMAFVTHEKSPENIENKQDEPIFPQESLSQGSEDDFTDSDLEDDEDVSPETRLSSLVTDICEAIDCLLRLSVAIANPAPHERFRKLGAGPSEDVSFYEAHDIRHVRDKFPKANQGLCDVLGKLITRRRQFFKYREAHHAKLAAGLDQEAQKDTSRTEIIPETVASSIPGHFKGAAVIDEDNRSDTAISETSYATSVGFLMQEDEQMRPVPPLKVPPPPPGAEKGVFECPFCYRMISTSTRGAWKRHVFGDLRPYTCIFSQCAESNTDFDRRHQWQRHVSQCHWRTWYCLFECQGRLPSAVKLGDHIRHQHLPNASDEHLSALVARGEVPASDDVSEECPLCGRVVSGLNSYIKHVGRHLEQLALFALPNIEDGVSEENTDSDEQNDGASELNARSAAKGPKIDDEVSETKSDYESADDVPGLGHKWLEGQTKLVPITESNSAEQDAAVGEPAEDSAVTSTSTNGTSANEDAVEHDVESDEQNDGASKLSVRSAGADLPGTTSQAQEEGATGESTGRSGEVPGKLNARNAHAHPRFSCTICGKSFTRKINLSGHERSHYGDRPYKCVCGKAFARLNDLRRHEKIHKVEEHKDSELS